MELVLNEESLSKCWGGSTEYWFSHKDYKIRNIAEMHYFERPDDMSQTSYFLSVGFIPYFKVTNEEVIRSYINHNTNKKIVKAFSKVSDEDYVETFWKYFNAYKEISQTYREYEENYVKKKAVDWCRENGVRYRFEN